MDVLEIAGDFDGAHKVHRTIMLFEAARLARKAREIWRGGFSDYLNKALDEGENIREADYREALKQWEQILVIDPLNESARRNVLEARERMKAEARR